MWQNYLFPASIEEALEVLTAYNGQARLVAGGTDLILELQEGKRQVEALVDITRIPRLDAIELDKGIRDFQENNHPKTPDVSVYRLVTLS